MVGARYRPILRGVNSTRVWIKQANAECERLLLERCEPLDALTGGGARDRIRSLWRTLLENHPHDSICGCGIDDVHDLDMRPRFDRVRAGGAAVAAELAADLAGSGGRAVVWSALPWSRDAVVDVEGRPTVVSLGGLGVSSPRRADVAPVRSDGEGVLDNGRLRVAVATDGTFEITEVATGATWARQNVLVDDGDRGDEYTFSYAGPTVAGAAAPRRRATAVSGDRGTVVVDTVVRLPRGLREDRLARVAETVDCPARISVSLDSGSDRVDVSLEIDNQARDHRLRAEFDTRTRTLTHHAGAAFALLERANRVPPRPGWVEPPTAERCVHDIVLVRGPSAGLAIGVDGMRDYAVLRDGATIAVTLLRCMGWLSRGDMRERRGHAGPALETPSAQCIGPQRFRYCVVPLGGNAPLGDAYRSVRSFLSPPWVAVGDGEQRTYLQTMWDPTDAAVAVTSLRAGPDGRIVLRAASLAREPASMSLRFHRPIRSARSVDLREGEDGLGNTGLDVIRAAAPLDLLPDGGALARLQPGEIGTWLIELG
jgi:hypothetical protein